MLLEAYPSLEVQQRIPRRESGRPPGLLNYWSTRWRQKRPESSNAHRPSSRRLRFQQRDRSFNVSVDCRPARPIDIPAHGSFGRSDPHCVRTRSICFLPCAGGGFAATRVNEVPGSYQGHPLVHGSQQSPGPTTGDRCLGAWWQNGYFRDPRVAQPWGGGPSIHLTSDMASLRGVEEDGGLIRLGLACALSGRWGPRMVRNEALENERPQAGKRTSASFESVGGATASGFPETPHE